MTITRSQLILSGFLVIFLMTSPNVAAVAIVLFLMLLVFTRRSVFPPLRSLGLHYFFGLFIVCLMSTLFFSPFEMNSYFLGRDIYYFLAPVGVIFIGLYLSQTDVNPNRLLWTIIVTLTLISLYDHIEFFLSGAFLNLTIEARYDFRLNSSNSVLVCVMLMSAFASNIRLGTTKLRWIVFSVNLALIFFSLSRVNLGILILTLVIVFIRRNSLRLAMVSLIFGFVVLPLAIAPFIPQSSVGFEAVGFIDKTLNSIREMAIQDQDSMSGINLNWRGYEAFKGIEAVRQNGGGSILFGLGFGSYVEGPFQDKLNFIPVFHNGYVTVFVKGGLVGTALFLLFLHRLSYGGTRFAHQLEPQDRVLSLFWERTLILLVAALAMNTLATHGVFYTKAPLSLLILGLLHGARHKLKLSAAPKNADWQQAPAKRFYFNA